MGTTYLRKRVSRSLQLHGTAPRRHRGSRPGQDFPDRGGPRAAGPHPWQKRCTKFIAERCGWNAAIHKCCKLKHSCASVYKLL
jgi:hypothetical protein